MGAFISPAEGGSEDDDVWRRYYAAHSELLEKGADANFGQTGNIFASCELISANYLQALCLCSICPVLFSLRVVEMYSRLSTVSQSKSDRWNRHCGQFKDLIASLLDLCACQEDVCMLLEIGSSPTEVLELAVQNKVPEFLAHWRVQTYITTLWLGHKTMRTGCSATLSVSGWQLSPKSKFQLGVLSRLTFVIVLCYSACAEEITVEVQDGIDMFCIAWGLRKMLKELTDAVQENSLLPILAPMKLPGNCIVIAIVAVCFLRLSSSTFLVGVDAHIFGALSLLAAGAFIPGALLMSSVTGPLILILKGMMVDVVLFLSIYIASTAAFAVAFTAIYQEEVAAQKDFGTFRAALSTLNYATFTQLEGSALLPADGLLFDDLLGTVLVYLYLFLSLVMLMTLLISMLSFTFGRIADNSETEWLCMRAGGLLSALRAPMLPPPFSLPEDMMRILFHMCCKPTIEQHGGLREPPLLFADVGLGGLAFRVHKLISRYHLKQVYKREQSAACSHEVSLLTRQFESLQERIQWMLDKLS